MRNWQIVLLALLFAGAGVGALVLAWRPFERTRAFVSTARRTEGTVVDVLERRDHDPDTRSSVTYYSAVVSYQDVAGRPFSCSGSSWTTWKPRLGRKVKILVDPRDPAIVRKNGPVALWATAVIEALIGLGLLAAARSISSLWPSE